MISSRAVSLSKRSCYAYVTGGGWRLGCTRMSVGRHCALFSTETVDPNILKSKFPDIPSMPYPPLPEFVGSRWSKHLVCDDRHSMKLEESVMSTENIRSKKAIIDGSTEMSRTFGEMDDNMVRIAHSLKESYGLKEGGSTVLFCPNHVDYLTICLSVGMCGAMISPVNPLYTARELTNVLNQSYASILFVHEDMVKIASESIRDCKGVKHVIVIPRLDCTISDDFPESFVSLEELRNSDGILASTSKSIFEDSNSEPYLLPFSSGTTGLPKGVCLSHSNLIANLYQLEVVERGSFTMDHSLISPLPFFHIYGFVVSNLYCAWQGNTVITMSGRFDLERYCQLVEMYRPDRSHLVPPIILLLAKNPVVDKYDVSSVKMIVSAAAPLSDHIEKGVFDRVGSRVKQAWGMSELSPIATFQTDDAFKSGSIGTVTASTEGKVVDIETGCTVGPGVQGELMIKGPQVMLGYLDAPEKTAECLSEDGWLRTGDICDYDEEGYLYIKDRKKELIKVRGFPVAPAELEALLLTHEDIKDAAVVPVQREDGELPKAFVVIKEDSRNKEITDEDISKWFNNNVAPYKRLHGGIEFIDEIPKTASGKILRRLLVERQKKSNT